VLRDDRYGAEVPIRTNWSGIFASLQVDIRYSCNSTDVTVNAVQYEINARTALKQPEMSKTSLT